MVSVERIREYEGIMQESYSSPRPSSHYDIKSNGETKEDKKSKYDILFIKSHCLTVRSVKMFIGQI